LSAAIPVNENTLSKRHLETFVG